MAKRPSSDRQRRPLVLNSATLNCAILSLALAQAFFVASTLLACPFCTAVAPSLVQWREQSAVVALAEVVAAPAAGLTTLELHQVLSGRENLGDVHSLNVQLDAAVKPGGLALLFGKSASGDDKELTWHAVGVSEISYAYFSRAPLLKLPTAERLRYFGRFLEHADPLVAEDAYLEFGHAPFDQVAQAADSLSLADLRRWLVDPKVPPHRKGFYGLAVGLRAQGDQRAAAAEFLRTLIIQPEDDFRSGFDGVLGGYLLLAGEPGLELIESRYLANPKARDGDVRHALTALRFYHEYGQGITTARLSQAVARLLTREEFAEAAIVDLARWQCWDALELVTAVYERPTSELRARRAVIGYLLACPGAAARNALARLRANDPRGVADAEQVLSQTSGTAASEQ